MHKKLILSAVVPAACLVVMPFSALAGAINYDLSNGTTGSQSLSHSFTNQNLTFSGWEYDNSLVSSAVLYHKVRSNPDETGLGVNCQSIPTGSKCTNHEIDSSPSQAISISGISSLLNTPDFYNLSIGVGSVDGNGGPTTIGGSGNVNEQALIWGLTNNESDGSSLASATNLGVYTYSGGLKHHTFNLSKSMLQPYSAVELTTGGGAFSRGFPGNGGLNGNVLLSSVSAAVPEPGALGILGAGLLFIGFLARGLGRRSSRI